MKTITLLISLGFVFILIASCEQSVSIVNNDSVQDTFATQSSNNIIIPDSCCDTISHSKKGETDFNEELRIINCKQTIKEGRIELLSFVNMFEKLSDSISDSELLILGKKYIEKIEDGDGFTNEQIQATAKLLTSLSVSTFANCCKLAIDNPKYSAIKQFYYKNMSKTNKDFFIKIKNEDLLRAIKENDGLGVKSEKSLKNK